MSANKTYCTAFGIHLVPAGTTLQDFEAKCQTLITSLLALPVAQNNYLKFDILTQNDTAKNALSVLGFPAPQPAVYLRAYLATVANWTAIHLDADYMKLLSEAQSWGFQTGASVFLSNLVTKLEDTILDTNAILGIHQVGQDMAELGIDMDKFFQMLSAVATAFLDLGSLIPNFPINTMGLLNGNADAAASGYASSQPAVISITECNSLTTDLSGNFEVKAFVAQAVETLSGVHTFCSIDVNNVWTSPGFTV
ncbi:hypothetical protein FB45DRAFT_945591, partial [Roridomyces roridus]